jgi:hypothetical protein
MMAGADGEEAAISAVMEPTTSDQTMRAAFSG